MELYTKDLVLKTVTDADIDEVARMWNFEKGSIPTKEAQKAIDSMQSNHKKNRKGCIYHLCLAVFEKDDPAIIGWCGLDGRCGDKLHLFYLIDAHYRNKGYATQCAEKLLSYAFEEAKVPFVNGGCDKANTASYAVMKKIGLLQSGFEENGDPLFFIDARTYHAQRAESAPKAKAQAAGKQRTTNRSIGRHKHE